MFGLNLLVLRCRDVDRARAFYECFGMTFGQHRHGAGPVHWAAEGASGVVELYPAKEPTPDDATGLGFAVDDLTATSAALADRGFEPGAAAEQPWGRTFVVRDPDGRRVEVQALTQTPSGNR